MSEQRPDDLRGRTQRALDKLAGVPAHEIESVKKLLKELRDEREYDLMGQLAEALSRREPDDPTVRRLYAQYLIDTGKVTAALDVLSSLRGRLPIGHREAVEVEGLIGRCHKQLFVEAGERTSAAARASLSLAIAAYRTPFEANPAANTWHGVNLLALLAAAERAGLDQPSDPRSIDVARRLFDALQATAPDQRDVWYLGTLAETCLGLDDWDAVEGHVRAYVAGAARFQIASMLRQFTEVWGLADAGAGERGRGLIKILCASQLLDRGKGPDKEPVRLDPLQVRRLRAERDPDAAQLQAILGKDGPKAYRWWKTGLDRATGVAAVYEKLGSRAGTGFLVRAGDLGLEPANETVLMTNFHVVNERGLAPGLRPEAAEVVFEAVEAQPRHDVRAVVWSSPIEMLDAAVLRLDPPVEGISPLPFAKQLPLLEEGARVYVVGHPGGRDLAFSFRDNELLDHEGPPSGRERIEGRCRVHYRAPTEGGSSGSPVFNDDLWEVVALHHMGGRTGVERLNGAAGTYGANEGIAIRSIAAASKHADSAHS